MQAFDLTDVDATSKTWVPLLRGNLPVVRVVIRESGKACASCSTHRLASACRDSYRDPGSGVAVFWICLCHVRIGRLDLAPNVHDLVKAPARSGTKIGHRSVSVSSLLC